MFDALEGQKKPLERALLITIEVPTDWLKNPLDGHRHQQYFKNVQKAAAKLGHEINLVPIKFGSDFEPRQSEPGNLLLSFHSVGESGNVLRIKEAAAYPYYCFEGRGHSGWSQLATDKATQEKALNYNDPDSLAYLEYFAKKYRENRSSKYPQNASHGVKTQGYVLYLMQLAQDPVAHFARMTQFDIIDKLAELADKTGVDVIFKRHPHCKDKLVKNHLARRIDQSKHLHLSEANVVDLISSARSVVTVNSGSGFETLLLGKAHYSVGSSEWDAISHQVLKPDDLSDAFLPTQCQKPNTQNYLAYLLCEYWVDITNVMAIRERIQRKLEEIKTSNEMASRLLHVEMTREEFCRYLVMNNRHKRFEEIIKENELLRKKLSRTTRARIRKFFGKQRWYEE